jgi:mannose-6-phosphate isomerase
MKITGLFQGDLNIKGAWQEILDNNDKYNVSILHVPENTETNIYGDAKIVHSYYVLEGSVEVSLYNLDESRKIDSKEYIKQTGWSVLPEQKQKLRTKGACTIFMVSAGVEDRSKLVDVSGRNPLDLDKMNSLSDYMVDKPWGSEAWLVENGIFVLKGITMNAGSECSLQVHEKKVEVNLILRGEAKVSLGFDQNIKDMMVSHDQAGKPQSEFSVSDDISSKVKHDLPASIYSKYQGWTVKPYQIHQVLSLETYFALEVSTPEVDDIVRLKDLYNRPGGRIANEHKSNQ